jgi:beta-glucosidase
VKATKRIDDLLARMTLEEKLGQLNMLSAAGDSIRTSENAALVAAVSAGQAGSVLNLVGAQALRETQELALKTRLGIPLLFCFDVVHGYRTIFPIPLGEAASFNPTLWQKTARCAAQEASADGIALTFAPMLDISRDPRWGRSAEGPGEDTWLAVQFARAKVRGFQGSTDDLTRGNVVAATAKHFCAYGAVTAGRDYAPVDMSDDQLHEIYLPPFKAAVEEGAAAIMPAFTDLVGVPLSAHHALLTTLVREQWQFDGVYISDYHAIAELINHGIADDLAQAAALALRAGMDIDMMSFAYIHHLPEALTRGLVCMNDIDQAVRRVLTLKEKLGLFDNPYRFTPQAMPSIESRHLARDAARASIVLLRNDEQILPLAPHGGRCIILTTSDDLKSDALGSWSGAGEVSDVSGFDVALRAALPEREHEYRIIRPDDMMNMSVQNLRATDDIILCLGERREMSGEAASRAHPTLSAHEIDLIDALDAKGLRFILVLASGRPLIAPHAFAKAKAMIASWFLGIEAGPALADVLTGQVDATGRLPLTWPRAIGQIPITYGQRPSGRPFNKDDFFTSKYIDETNEPQFVFGHGLSYTEFAYTDLICRADGPSLHISARLRNSGNRAGVETIFLFIHRHSHTKTQPSLELRGIEKAALNKGDISTVSFTLSGQDLKPLSDRADTKSAYGFYDIYVGPCADKAKLLTSKVYYDGQFTIPST